MKRRGLIVERHRREVVIECEAGERRTGLIRGRKLKALTGDEVVWRLAADGTAIVDALLPRRSVLERIDSRGRPEGVAANLSLLVVVVAPAPAPDWRLLDHYLVSAELAGITAAIVRNKADLAAETLDQRLGFYQQLGYGVIASCCQPGGNTDELSEVLRGERSMLAGQSGVGKSSLLNTLLGFDAQAVGRLSERRPLGRHTTTSSVLHRLPLGGELVDSPGVRRYAPYIPDLSRLDAGFVEFRPHIGHCRFRNCRHVSEPGCAVRAAVDRGEIDPMRLQSYAELGTTLERIGSD